MWSFMNLYVIVYLGSVFSIPTDSDFFYEHTLSCGLIIQNRVGLTHGIELLNSVSLGKLIALDVVDYWR